MNPRHAAALALVLFASLSFIASCAGNPKPEHHNTLLEVIDVTGTCHEDHTNQWDGYAGQIVRWRDDETKQVLTYGSVMNTSEMNPNGMARRALDEASHPNAYQTPDSIDFSDIRLDTNQPKWTLHGISDSRSNGTDFESGYNSTCELSVTKRGKELNPSSTATP